MPQRNFFCLALYLQRSNDGKNTKDFGWGQEMHVSALQVYLEYLQPSGLLSYTSGTSASGPETKSSISSCCIKRMIQITFSKGFRVRAYYAKTIRIRPNTNSAISSLLGLGGGCWEIKAALFVLICVKIPGPYLRYPSAWVCFVAGIITS